MSKTFSGAKNAQNQQELDEFVEFLVKKRVTRYLEIGSRHGDTFHYVMRHLPRGSVGLAVDLPNGLWGMPGSNLALERACMDLRRKGYKAQCMFADSQKDFTQIAIQNQYKEFDAVLIDGDHTLPGVTQDYENYKDMAKFVAFHDIVDVMQTNRRGETIEVPVFWQQLKKIHKNVVEFIYPGSSMGIGVVIQNARL
jgi:hypothetical protein